ncbi:MAG: hypothetical protein QXQ39_07610 [Conexivisphaerales archaeon]
MPQFSFLVFTAVLWALTTESVEDSFADLVYARMFGWRKLALSAIAAGAIIIFLSVILSDALAFLPLNYYTYIRQIASSVIILIGLYWLIGVFAKHHESGRYRSDFAYIADKKSYYVLIPLMLVEEAEIAIIILPLALRGYAIEALSGAGISIAVSLYFSLVLQNLLGKVMAKYYKELKGVSAMVLIALGLLLLLNAGGKA